MRALFKFIPIKSLQEIFRGNDFLLQYGLESRKISKASSDDDRTVFAAARRVLQDPVDPVHRAAADDEAGAV